MPTTFPSTIGKRMSTRHLTVCVNLQNSKHPLDFWQVIFNKFNATRTTFMNLFFVLTSLLSTWEEFRNTATYSAVTPMAFWWWSNGGGGEGKLSLMSWHVPRSGLKNMGLFQLATLSLTRRSGNSVQCAKTLPLQYLRAFEERFLSIRSIFT